MMKLVFFSHPSVNNKSMSDWIEYTVFPLSKILLMATRNPARKPVEVGRLSHDLQGCIHPRWCRISCFVAVLLDAKGRVGGLISYGREMKVKTERILN